MFFFFFLQWCIITDLLHPLANSDSLLWHKFFIFVFALSFLSSYLVVPVILLRMRTTKDMAIPFTNRTCFKKKCIMNSEDEVFTSIRLILITMVAPIGMVISFYFFKESKHTIADINKVWRYLNESSLRYYCHSSNLFHPLISTN